MRRILVLAAAFAALSGTAMAAAQARGPVSVISEIDPGGADTARVEGLVADSRGYLYTSDIANNNNRLFRITPSTGLVETLVVLPRTATGMAFDRAGNLYMASRDAVLRIAADKIASGRLVPEDATIFASNTQGANGLAFDSAGNLYVSGGATGTIYRVTPNGQAAPWLTGFTGDRQEQQISTNGLAFGPDGLLYSANTSSGAIDRVRINADGSPGDIERFVTDQRLLGADGIAFAANGDLYVAANERNAIVVVRQDGSVNELFANSNAGPLEFPASPAFIGTSLYVSNFDQPRGANNPNSGGRGAGVAAFDAGVAGAPLAIGTVNAPAQPAATAVPTAAPTSAPAATPRANVPSQLPNTSGESPAFALWAAAAVALAAGVVIRRRGSK